MFFVVTGQNLESIWDHWQGEDGHEIDSCSIITTEANKLMLEIHDRMPVILDKNDLAIWLNPGIDQERVLSMLKPCPESWIETYPVSSRVNRVKNNGPACMKKIPEPLG